MPRSLNRLIVPLLLVALLAAVGWWWAHAERISGGAVPVAELDAGVESSSTAETLDLPEEERGVESEAPSEARTAAETEEAPAPEPEVLGIRLHVVDGAGAPVAGAEVDFFQTVKPWTSWGALQLAVGGLRASAEKLGAPDRFVTDDDGLALLPTAYPAGLIGARSGDTEGFMFADADLVGDVELVLVPLRRTVVRIVDSKGEPRPGARLFVTASLGSEFFADKDGRFDINVNLIELVSSKVELDAGMPAQSVNLGKRGVLKPTVPKDPAPKATFTTGAPPDEIVLSTLPMGIVRIELVDAGGQPATIGFPMLDFVLTFGEDRWNAAFSQVGDTGPTLDTWLPSGAEFVASFQDVLAQTPRVTREGVVPGNGEPPWVWQVEVEGVPEVLVEGRLVDSHGAPLRLLRTSLVYKAEAPSPIGRRTVSRVNGLPLVTDVEGHFEAKVPVTMAKALQGPRAWLVLAFEDKGRGTAGTRMAQVELENPGTPARIQAGDCVMEPPPMLFAGRFVDPSGGPLEGVRWSLSERINLRGRSIFREASNLNVASRQLSDSGGHFEVRGSEPDGAFAVIGRKAGWIQLDPVEAAVGDEDLVVTLVPAGNLVGSVELNPARPKLTVSLRPSADNPVALPLPGGGGTPGGAWTQKAFPDPDGNFEFKGLAPGLYDLAILAGAANPFGNDGTQLWAATGIAVEAGAASSDPRLSGIVLDAPSPK